MASPAKVVGLMAGGLAAVALVRVVAGLARSYAQVLRHYRLITAPGVDTSPEADARREQLAAEFAALSERLTAHVRRSEVPRPGINWPTAPIDAWPVDLLPGPGAVPERDLVEPPIGEPDPVADAMAGRPLGPVGEVDPEVERDHRHARDRYDPTADYGQADPPGTYMGGLEHMHLLAGRGRRRFTGSHVHLIDGGLVVHNHAPTGGWACSPDPSPRPGGRLLTAHEMGPMVESVWPAPRED